MHLTDRAEQLPVQAHSTQYRGRVWDVVSEEVDLGAAGVVTRDYIDHPGAVAILAIDDDDKVVLIQQYRHPIGTFEWEIPAGLRDVAGEPDLRTAQRELAEEADLHAATWQHLIQVATSPGSSSETITIFLARDLTNVPEHQRHTRDGEELDMPTARVHIDELCAAILEGRVHNGTLIQAVLAARVAREQGWDTLPPAE